MISSINDLVEYIPILTTLFGGFFFWKIFSHYRLNKSNHLKWWTLGVLTFILGTGAESVNALFGWSAINMKFWYIVGALLGGFPLAQGTVYLLMNKKFADITSIVFSVVIVIASGFIIASPINNDPEFTGGLTGDSLGWNQVRLVSPFINIYAFIFLVGGAIYSAYKYQKDGVKNALYSGNILIAIGGLLPGIGGSFTRAGYVEVLYITEFLGLLLIYFGYTHIRNFKASVSIAA